MLFYQVNLLGQVWVLREFLPSMIKMNRLGPVLHYDADVALDDDDDDAGLENQMILWGGEHFS